MTTQLSIKTEEEIKKAAQKKAAEQGITLTVAVNSFLKKFSEGEFRFELTKKQEEEITVDELFRSKKIVERANKIARYLSSKEL